MPCLLCRRCEGWVSGDRGRGERGREVGREAVREVGGENDEELESWIDRRWVDSRSGDRRKGT